MDTYSKGAITIIPLSEPLMNGNELKYIQDAVSSGWVSSTGKYVGVFENKISEYIGANVCACVSGTAGLHLCLRHYGIGANDIVLVPVLTFIATIYPVLYQNATPVFIDCDESMCISTEKIHEYITKCCDYNGRYLVEKKRGLRVKAIIPVHVFGVICDMKGVMEIADEYGLTVIEDAAEAFGSVCYDGRHAGTIGHAGVYSFNGNKIITSGGGGAVVSSDANMVAHTKYLSEQAKDDNMYYIHNEIGYNYRMNNLSAAIGYGQLERIDEFIKIKQRNLKLYKEALSDCAIGGMMNYNKKSNFNRWNHWFYSFVLNPSIGNIKRIAELRDRLLTRLTDNGIQARPIWRLNHKQIPLTEYDIGLKYENAERFYASVINLPCGPALTEEQIVLICKIMSGVEND